MSKPSVTQLIKLLDKPALLSWANKQGLLGIDIQKKRQEVMSDGTTIHSQIEHYVKHKTPFEHQAVFDVFMQGKTIINLETDIETEWFTGRYDAKLDWGGCPYLVDWKRKAKRIYFEHKLQLAAYGMAEPCERFAIVSVPSFQAMTFEIKDRRPYEEIIKALSIIHQQKILINEF